jgi:hypothetical protein
MENWGQRHLHRDNYNKESKMVSQASFGWQFCPALLGNKVKYAKREKRLKETRERRF